MKTMDSERVIIRCVERADLGKFSDAIATILEIAFHDPAKFPNETINDLRDCFNFIIRLDSSVVPVVTVEELHEITDLTAKIAEDSVSGIKAFSSLLDALIDRKLGLARKSEDENN